jgi:hypothetical protein
MSSNSALEISMFDQCETTTDSTIVLCQAMTQSDLKKLAISTVLALSCAILNEEILPQSRSSRLTTLVASSAFSASK